MSPHRAQAALTTLARDYPDVWRTTDEVIHSAAQKGISWPAWCWAPMAASYAVVSAAGLSLERAGDIARVSALTAWRVTQGIYRFDETLLDELWTSDIDGALPVDTLLHLPEWCVYVETHRDGFLHGPLAANRLHGFWAHLESDANDGRVELRLLLDFEEGGLVGVPLHLGHGRGTLRDAVSGTLDEALANVAQQQGALGATQFAQHRAASATAMESVKPLVSLLLYLCTAAEELRTSDGRVPGRPSPRPARRGEPPRYFPPDAPATFPTGLRLGAQLRAARERVAAARPVSEGAGVQPMAHVRRAHWHTYLMGPRDTAQRREVRWLPPILVGLGPDEVAPVVRVVK